MLYSNIPLDCWMIVYHYLIRSKYDIFNYIVSNPLLYKMLDDIPVLNKVVRRSNMRKIPFKWLEKITYIFDKREVCTVPLVKTFEVQQTWTTNTINISANTNYDFKLILPSKTYDIITSELSVYGDITNTGGKIDTLSIKVRDYSRHRISFDVETLILDYATKYDQVGLYGKCETLVIVNCTGIKNDFFKAIEFRNLVVKNCIFNYHLMKYLFEILDKAHGFAYLDFSSADRTYYMLFTGSLDKYKNIKYIIRNKYDYLERLFIK